MSKISLQFSSSYEWAVVGFKWSKPRKDKEYRTTTNGQTVFIGKIDWIFSRFSTYVIVYKEIYIYYFILLVFPLNLTPMLLIYLLNLNIQPLRFSSHLAKTEYFPFGKCCDHFHILLGYHATEVSQALYKSVLNCARGDAHDWESRRVPGFTYGS